MCKMKGVYVCMCGSFVELHGQRKTSHYGCPTQDSQILFLTGCLLKKEVELLVEMAESGTQAGKGQDYPETSGASKEVLNYGAYQNKNRNKTKQVNNSKASVHTD